MAGIQAKPCKIGRDIVDNALQLIGEFDISARMGMDRRMHSVFVARECRDRVNVVDHALPGFIIEARSPIRMARGEVAHIMPPVHHGEIRRCIALTRMGFGLGQPSDQRAYLIGLSQQVVTVCRRNEIVEYRACNDLQTTLIERIRHTHQIEWQITVGPKLQTTETGRLRFIKHLFPRGKMRIFDIIDTPATGSRRYGDWVGHQVPAVIVSKVNDRWNGS